MADAKPLILPRHPAVSELIPYVIVEQTDDLDHPRWDSNTGEYFPQ